MDPNLLNRYPPPNPRGSGHRRAQSETHFRLPELDDDDNLLLLSDFDLDFPETGPTKSDLDSGPEPPPSTGPHHHSRSFSFDDGLGFHPRQHHHHKRSGSMDDGDSSTSTISKEKLAELALVDPKRAKRILANRQSAARSKERKIKYTGELERKMQTLQTEATTLSAQLTLLQRDTTGLTAENRELKLRLQAMEQQAHLRDALNEALREEVQRLKIATGQIPNTNGNAFNRSLQHSTTSPFFSRPQLMTNSNTHQVQQLHNSQSQTPPSQPFGDDSMDFM